MRAYLCRRLLIIVFVFVIVMATVMTMTVIVDRSVANPCVGKEDSKQFIYLFVGKNEGGVGRC